MPFLYINEERSKLHYEASRLIVETGTSNREVPIETVTGVVLFGKISVSTPCMIELLKRGISLVWLSKRGKFFGRLESTQQIDIIRQRKQFSLGEDENFCLKFSQRIIDGKINNQKIFLRRLQRSGVPSSALEKALTELTKLQLRLPFAQSISELMGYEGAVSRAYFKALSAEAPLEYKFNGRSKQPPLDKFNSLLSFGYTLLMYEIHSAIEAAGLNPYAAFMHKDKRNHPALASDLMEEWRTILIDATVLDMVRRQVFRPDEFTWDEGGGVYLTGTGVKKLVSEYEKKLAIKSKYLDYLDSPVSFREGIHHQVERLARAIREMDAQIYSPIKIR